MYLVTRFWTNSRPGIFSYLIGRLTNIKTQRNIFRGREGFAIAVEHLEAKFGGAIITIFSSLLQMDVSAYLLCTLPMLYYAHTRAGLEI